LRLVAGCIVAVFLVGLIQWQAILSFLGNYLVYSERPQAADLILALAGNFYGPRVIKAAELAVEGYAPLALISGTPYQGRPEDRLMPEGELAIIFLAKQGYPTHLFESFGHQARSTIEEAIALRGELARRHVKRVLLVTSAYHSRRAAVVFRLFCPGIQFISVPGPEPSYHPDVWWKEKHSRMLFYSEWTKIIGTVLLAYPKDLIERMLVN
jgi:uncharacterized SAM-binding protein YcdF (DUF218 family)